MAIVRMKYKVTVENGKEKWEVVGHLTPGSSCKTQDNAEIIKRIMATPVAGFGETDVSGAEVDLTAEEMDKLVQSMPSIQTHVPEDAPPPDDGGDPTIYRQKDKDISLGFDT